MLRKFIVSVLTLFMVFCTITLTFSSAETNYQMVPQGPDISISNLTFSDTELDEDDNLTISIEVQNNESIPMDRVNITVYSNAQEIYNFTDKTLDPKSSNTYTFQWKAEGGTQNISAVLSYRGNPLMDTQYSKEIYVEPKPIGDIYFPVLILSLILLVVFSVILVPSIRSRL